MSNYAILGVHHRSRCHIKHLVSISSQPDWSGMQWLSKEAALVLRVGYGSWVWSRLGRRPQQKIVEWATPYCTSLMFQVSHGESKCSNTIHLAVWLFLAWNDSIKWQPWLGMARLLRGRVNILCSHRRWRAERSRPKWLLLQAGVNTVVVKRDSVNSGGGQTMAHDPITVRV